MTTDSDLDAHGDEDALEPVEERESRVPARRPGAAPVGAPVSREELERVIRRASELQFRSSTSIGGELQQHEVIEIGAEVGLDERHMKQALAEVQAAALVPAQPRDRGLLRRIAGPSIVTASRVVPGDRPQVEQNLEEYLKEKELLRQVRSRPGRQLWEPAGGLVSQMKRAMDVGGHGYVLAKARNVQVAVEPLESGWSLVTLTADLTNVRNERVGAWFGGVGIASVGATMALVIPTGGAILPVLGAVALISGGVGAAAALARKDMTKQLQRTELALQGLLDRLERGEDLHAEVEPWHRKLLG